MRTIRLSVLSALILVLATVGTALAWVAPQLEPECADDENTYAWTITLNPEDNQNIQLAWVSDFSVIFDTIDFQTSGSHAFTTPRGGTTLFVRYESDHGAKDSALANGELCEPPSETQPESEPEGSVGGGTGAPPQGGSIPDTATSIPSQAGPLATLGAGMILLASLGALAYANVRASR